MEKYRKCPAGIAGVVASSAAAALMAFGVASSASGQLILATDSAVEGIWGLDVETNEVVKILDGFGASAMAVDRASSTLYFMPNTVTLWKWDYSDITNTPQLVGTVRNPANTSNLSVVGLAFDPVSDTLFASRGLQSGAGPTGFYRVDTDTAATQLAFSVSSQFRFDGFDYDTSTGRFFANSDRSPGGAGIEGIFEVDFENDQVVFVAPYPTETAVIPADIDGLAAGDGKIYLVEDKAVQAMGRVYVFNTVTGAYEDPLLVPWFYNDTFAGATWAPELFAAFIPEPGSAAAALMTGFYLLRRRGRAVA